MVFGVETGRKVGRRGQIGQDIRQDNINIYVYYLVLYLVYIYIVLSYILSDYIIYKLRYGDKEKDFEFNSRGNRESV